MEPLWLATHGDPFSPLTRQKQRNLLVTSVVGVLVAKAGLAPTQIQALGITFSSVELTYLRIVLGAAIMYFAVAFFLYGRNDLFARDLAIKAGARKRYEYIKKRSERLMERLEREVTPLDFSPPINDAAIKVALDAAGQAMDFARQVFQELEGYSQQMEEIDLAGGVIGPEDLPRMRVAELRARFDFGVPLAVGVVSFLLVLL